MVEGEALVSWTDGTVPKDTWSSTMVQVGGETHKAPQVVVVDEGCGGGVKPGRKDSGNKSIRCSNGRQSRFSPSRSLACLLIGLL